MLFIPDYLDNDCGSTIYVSYDEQIRVNLTYSSHYSNYMDCNVTFETSPGMQMKIYVGYTDIESCCDWLELYDGDPDNTNLLGEFLLSCIIS